jgi:hypothetical protein
MTAELFELILAGIVVGVLLWIFWGRGKAD